MDSLPEPTEFAWLADLQKCKLLLTLFGIGPFDRF